MTKYPPTLPVLPPLDIKGSWITPLRVCESYCHDSKKFCKSDTSHWDSSPVVLAPRLPACLSPHPQVTRALSSQIAPADIHTHRHRHRHTHTDTHQTQTHTRHRHTHRPTHFLAYVEGMQPSKAHHRTHFLWQVSQTLSPNRKPQIGLPEAPMTSLRPSGLLPVIHLELFLSGSAQDVC